MPSLDALRKSAGSFGGVMLRTVLLLGRFAVGVGILVYLAKSRQIDISSVGRLFTAWRITAAALVFLLLDIIFMSIRASLLFGDARLTLSLGNSIQLNLIGFFFSSFLPGAAGGDLAKLVYATRQNRGRRAEVATVLILDRLVGLFSLILLPLLIAPFLSDLLRSAPVLRHLIFFDALLAAIMLTGAAFAMFVPPATSWVARLLRRWPRLEVVGVRVAEALALHGQARAGLFIALLLSLLANLALIAVTGLAFYAVSPASFSIKLAFVAPLGHLFNSLPLTPGGIGVGETAFNSLFALAGMSRGAETLLCLRVWNLFVGFLGLVVYLVGMGRIVHPYEEETSEPQTAYIGVEPAN